MIAVSAQDKMPTIKSNVTIIDIQDGEKLSKGNWSLAPDAKPDVYEAELIDGKPHKVTFITDVDSISFMVEEGKKYDFIIQHGSDACYTQIVGVRFVPQAVFDKKYRDAHRGKIAVDIPEVYELVNIAIAMTPTGIANKDLVYQNSEYYKAVRKWFDPFQGHSLLAALEAVLKTQSSRYFTLKMNGNAFVFDKNGKIVRSKIFDRTGFSGERTNSLLPFLDKLQAFSDATNFRAFYRQNRTTYDEQIRFYRETANIAGMKTWLDKNFPSSNDYSFYNVIFSPLVAYNQSSTWFESNGFKELQPHVNFPYEQDIGRRLMGTTISAESETIFRGNIVFTEINHRYINPEAEKYAAQIAKATSNRDHWVDKKMGPNYYAGIGAFDEYMNWALVSLRIADLARREDRDAMIASVDRMMTKGRGFPQFELFDRFLLDLYLNRKPGQTLADLYPQIIEWFDKHNTEH